MMYMLLFIGLKYSLKRVEKTVKLQESGEMYLETIHVLSMSGKPVRSIDIAESMGFSKPSVSRAVGLLKNEGYIEVAPSGYITLTEKGNEVANRTYERHTLLTRALTALGISEKTAEEDACRIEHVISTESFEAIKKHLEKIVKD